uniref:Uncharacterized protein n=1 Tax=Panagrolaimus sp. PS1159 TaxID=55785 RepID=A0AC35F4R1_9BILA
MYDLDFRLPFWLDGSYGLMALIPRRMISQIRVFLDAFIVLVLMTGYREAIINVLKTMYFTLLNPQKTFTKTKSYFRKGTSVTIFVRS